jgi:predicted 2-oxoglutarate/Fe(II)-dependent dioxygenase YbiX
MVRPPVTDGILMRPDFYGPVACAKVRQAMDRAHVSPAEIYTEGYRVDRQARRAFDVEIGEDMLREVQRAMNTIRPDVARYFGIPLSDDEGPGFLRYLAGGFYRRHCDVLSEADEQFPRRISVVMFLTSAGEQCQGGALRIYHPEPFDIAPKSGTLVAFPSDMPHEVLPVTSGVRDVVVDWFF